MPITVADLDTFHAARGNTAWAALSAPEKSAALLNALDYVEANYAPLIEDYEAHPLYKTGVATLALRITEKPYTGIATQPVKSTKEEMAGMKSEVEYFSEVTDPYPGVTTIFARIQVKTHSGATFGKLVR